MITLVQNMKKQLWLTFQLPVQNETHSEWMPSSSIFFDWQPKLQITSGKKPDANVIRNFLSPSYDLIYHAAHIPYTKSHQRHPELVEYKNSCQPSQQWDANDLWIQWMLIPRQLGNICWWCPKEWWQSLSWRDFHHTFFSAFCNLPTCRAEINALKFRYELYSARQDWTSPSRLL